MWRSNLGRTLTMAVRHGTKAARKNLSPVYPRPFARSFPAVMRWGFSTAAVEERTLVAPAPTPAPAPAAAPTKEDAAISLAEVKKLMKLVSVEALKTKLGDEGKEVIGYSELLKACESMGVARSADEAAALARVLDEAGVVLLFRDKVYLHPDKVVDLVRRSVPLALTPNDDPRKEELKMLQERKEQIDKQAHKQVRIILWSGLGTLVMQVGLFFRLTFWDFSWDVMEPIAFFTTTTGLVIGYAYFMFTSKEPTYQDLMKTLFLRRQRKLIKKYNFDMNRFKELREKCHCPLDRKHLDENLRLKDA